MFTNKAKGLLVLGALLLFAASPVLAQRNTVRDDFTLFTPQQEFELGRALATEATNQLTFSKDGYAHGYINALGEQISRHAPGYRYSYEFEVFEDPEINAYAFPGGLVYVSSGLIQSAQTEPELAMILAHQIGHIVARHGSEEFSREFVNATNNNRARPTVANAIATLNPGFDPDSELWHYTAQQEAEADQIATQMLFRARFDPRQLPAAFTRLKSTSTGGARDFFLNHPTPANRTAAIRTELQRLGPLTANLRGDSPDLQTTKRRLRAEFRDRYDRGEPIGALTGNAGNNNYVSVPQPSTRMATYQGWDFELRHPENWRVTESGDSITIAPEGGRVSGSLAWGLNVATFQPQTRGFFPRSGFNAPALQLPGANSVTLSSATDQLIDDLRRSNPALQVVRTDSRRISGDPALVTELVNNSPIGGREVDRLYTVLRSDGTLQYFLGVSPQRDAGRYASVFDQIINSVSFYGNVR